jgi:hypothetical protein
VPSTIARCIRPLPAWPAICRPMYDEKIATSSDSATSQGS